MPRRAALIVNPVATGVTPARVADVLAELTEAGPVEKLVTEGKGHATDLASIACQRYEELFVYGGDGAYNEVVNGLTAALPVGFLPGGATSVLPRALGLPRDPVECARHLASSDRTRRISLGKVNGRRFTFCAGLGLDAELVRMVDQRGRGNGKRPGDLAFATDLGRILYDRRGRLDPILTVDGQRRCAFVVAANCDPYTYAGPVPLHAAPRARFELGLDLVGPERLTPGGFAQLVWSLTVRPTHHTAPDYLYLHDIDSATVVCDAPIPLQVDGEDLGDVSEALLESERGVLDVRI